MSDEFLSDPEHQEFAPDAFVAALQGEQFGGRELAPWTPPRKIAAQSMGMLYPFVGDAGFEAMERTGVYPGALLDVIIFLWLSLLEKPAEILRAQRKPTEAVAKATVWAETAGLIDLTSENFKTGYQLFAAKVGAIGEVDGNPHAPASARTPNAPDPKVSCGHPNGQNTL